MVWGMREQEGMQGRMTNTKGLKIILKAYKNTLQKSKMSHLITRGHCPCWTPYTSEGKAQCPLLKLLRFPLLKLLSKSPINPLTILALTSAPGYPPQIDGKTQCIFELRGSGRQGEFKVILPILQINVTGPLELNVMYMLNTLDWRLLASSKSPGSLVSVVLNCERNGSAG